MDTTTQPARAPEVIAPGAGHHLRFLDDRATVKVAAGEDGAMSVVEFTAVHGFGPPLHRHVHEDELFLVLDGELDFFTPDGRVAATAGAYAALPRAVPHTFQVVSSEARFLCITTSRTVAPGFDAMVTEAGTPVDGRIPEADGISPERLREICRRHGIEHLGPRPPLPVRSTEWIRPWASAPDRD